MMFKECATVDVMKRQITSLLDQSSFHLTNVYGPAHSDSKLAFITWLINLDSSDFEDWILLGDFNLYRALKIEINQGETLPKCNFSMT